MASLDPNEAAAPETGDTPVSPVSALPAHFHPRAADLAPGPFLGPGLVTPTPHRWHGARVYVVDVFNDERHLALRVTTSGALVGYWSLGDLIGRPQNE